jgi:hypothetical protein
LQAVLRRQIRELGEIRVSYDYKRIHALLQREGWKVKHKRVYWLYKMEGLSMRTKKLKRRHVSSVNHVGARCDGSKRGLVDGFRAR